MCHGYGGAYGYSNAYSDANSYPNGHAYANGNGYIDAYPDRYCHSVMLGDHFDALMTQPGPSAAPVPPPTAAGGTMSNSASEQAIMTDPLQQARIRTAASLEALKRLAGQTAQDLTSGQLA